MDQSGWSRRTFLTGVGLSVLGAGMPLHAARRQEATRERLYHEDREPFPNPERGLYTQRRVERPGRLDDLRDAGVSLVLFTIDLRDFKDRDLSPELLENVGRALDAARRAGLKAIVRAAYGFTGRDYRADPTDLGRIVGHIGQLGAVLAEKRDVIDAVQAGFLGPWGEWHGSNHGNPPSLKARRTVLFALLEAVPAPIAVQIRRPMFIRDIFADEPGGSTLTEATAHSGSKLARTGWHNDALLSLPTDMGTYAERGWDRQRELQWCANHGRYTPFGGETVPPSVRTPIDQVVRELELLHASYLNRDYHRGTLQSWREAQYAGENAFDHIERRLGYRLVAERLAAPSAVRPGGSLGIALDLANVGFAAPYLPREVAVGLVRRGDDRPAALVRLDDVDPRRWGPEAGTVRLEAAIPVPPDLPTGTWGLALRLADPAEGLREDGRYAIRLANTDIAFDGRTGWNTLAEDIAVG